MLKQRTLSKDIGLGVSVGIILVTLIYATIGNYFTLTFSTASIRLLYLPLYIVLFAITFFFYEVYRHTMEAQMGSKIARTILSPVYELVIIIISVLIQVYILVTVLQQNLGLFLIGVNMLLIFVMLAILIAEYFYNITNSWTTQIIVNSILFATTTVVSSPITNLF